MVKIKKDICDKVTENVQSKMSRGAQVIFQIFVNTKVVEKILFFLLNIHKC